MKGNGRQWKEMKGAFGTSWPPPGRLESFGMSLEAFWFLWSFVPPWEGQITATARVPKIGGVTPPILGKSLWGLGYERK